jgi:peptide/nickel transport system substrate-binding protein
VVKLLQQVWSLTPNFNIPIMGNILSKEKHMYRILNIIKREIARAALLLLLACAIQIGALPLSNIPSAEAGEGTIIMARGVDADNLDPHLATTTQSGQINSLIFDTLVTLDEKTRVHPGLAEAWEISSDGRSYTFTIRKGIKCHDGSTFDANSVKWNFDRIANPETNSPSLANWGNFVGSSVSGNKITLKLDNPFGPLLTKAGSMAFELICPSSLSGAKYVPIGTGPWKFVSWVRNDRIKLERYEGYKNFHPMVKNPGAPYEKYLEVRVIPEPIARMAALQTGEIHLTEPALEEASDLVKDPKYQIITSDYTGQQVWASFTWRFPPFDDVRVRRAVGYALDRNMYAAVAFEGLVKSSNCPIAPSFAAADQNKCAEWGQSYNIVEAKKLLAEAGYGPNNPINAVLSVHKLTGWDLMHQMMQQHLKAIGINVKIETREVAAFFDYMKTENQRTSGTPLIWTMGYSGPDPDYLHTSWSQPGFVNMGLNSDMDKMLEDQRVLTGQARNLKIQEIIKYLLSNAYAIPLVSPGWGWLMAASSNVTGFKYIHVSSMKLNDVKLL